MQALPRFTSETRRLRYAHAHLRQLFRYLPKQPGYNKRLRNAAALIVAVIRVLAADTGLWPDDVWVVDSTPSECGRSRETANAPSWPDGPNTGAAPCPRRRARTSGTALFKPLRQTVESINQTRKAQLDLERHGGRTPARVIVRILQRIHALTAAVWHNDHTSVPIHRSPTAYDH